MTSMALSFTPLSRTLLCSEGQHDCVQSPHYDEPMHSEMAAALAENTKLLMAERGWSQRDLAKKAEVSQAGVGYLLRYRDKEDRHASIDTVEKIGNAFGVPPHMLLVAGYASGDRRNVQAMPARKQASPSLDLDLVEFIALGISRMRKGTAAQRANIARAIYERVVRGEEVNTKVNVLRLVSSEGRLLRAPP